MKLQPDEYPALTSGMFSILASLPDVPRHPGARVTLADLSRWLPEAVRAEEEAREAALSAPSMIEFALTRHDSSLRNASNWTPEMRAKAAEAQRRRGIRQRAEREAAEAQARGEPVPPETAVALLLAKSCEDCERLAPKQCDRCYRASLHASRRKSPRPTRKQCEICKEEFSIGKMGHIPKYCSKTCANKAQEVRQKALRRKERLARIPKSCEHCGAELEREKSKIARWSRFCGASCRKRYNRAQAACRSHVPSICTEEGCRAPINEGFSGHGNWQLRCESCRKEVKKRRNREAYAKRKAEEALREAQQ